MEVVPHHRDQDDDEEPKGDADRLHKGNTSAGNLHPAGPPEATGDQGWLGNFLLRVAIVCCCSSVEKMDGLGRLPTAFTSICWLSPCSRQ